MIAVIGSCNSAVMHLTRFAHSWGGDQKNRDRHLRALSPECSKPFRVDLCQSRQITRPFIRAQHSTSIQAPVAGIVTQRCQSCVENWAKMRLVSRIKPPSPGTISLASSNTPENRSGFKYLRQLKPELLFDGFDPPIHEILVTQEGPTRLARGNGKLAQHSKLALQFASPYRLPDIRSSRCHSAREPWPGPYRLKHSGTPTELMKVQSIRGALFATHLLHTIHEPA